jgi:hypothetical protein
MAEPLGRLPLLLRQKINLLVPGGFSRRGWFSALKSSWHRTPVTFRTPSHASNGSLARSSDPQIYRPELHGLLETLQTIRKRILANTLLRSWVKWFAWLLIGLIAVGLVSARLQGVLLFVATLAIAGVAAIAVWTWRNRPSNYETALQLDTAAGLKDRVSTAVYLSDIADSDGMVGEQRKDALTRLSKVDARGYFPVQWPGNIKKASVLVLVVAGLLAYRIHHQPPLISLLQTTVRSQLVQSIFSPIVHAMEKDLQRTMALVNMKPDVMGDETQRGDAASNTDDLWKANDDNAAVANDPKDSADAGEGDQQDQLQPTGDQEGNPTGEARQQDGNSQSQQGKSGSDKADGKQQQSEQQGQQQGRQSMGQSLMQALKNMMSNSPNQQSNNRANQQPPNGQGTPQSGNSQQPGATESDKRGESRGDSDAKQKAAQTASEGAGSQQGTKELRKDQETHPVNAVPDRVALEASGFKEQTRMKVPTETGTAQLAVRDIFPQQDAAINGAEQENIPARYRFYVQRYFEHTDSGKH